MVIVPLPVSVPVVQLNAEVTVTSFAPPNAPPVMVSVAVLIDEVLLKFAVPDEMVTLPTLVTVPVKLAVPPLTVVDVAAL